MGPVLLLLLHHEGPGSVCVCVCEGWGQSVRVFSS